MKTKNLFKMLALATLAATPALAQTQNPASPSISTQVDMSREYAQAIMSKIGTNGSNRFNDSTDFSRIGPQLKATMEKALTEFREGLGVMLLPSFNQSVDRYNEIVNNKSLSETERADKLAQARTVLDQQATATASIYGSEIRRLYHIVPALLVRSFEHSGKTMTAIFAAGNEEYFWRGEYAGDGKRGAIGWNNLLANRSLWGAGHDTLMMGIYPTWINKYLDSVCDTRICYAGVISLLVDYISQVESFINRPIQITLADGQQLTINSLVSVRDSLPEYWVAKGLTSFTFNQEFSQLPIRN